MSVTFVGEAPSASTDRHRVPLAGETGRRLSSWAGLRPGGLARAARCLNLLEGFPGGQGRGAAFPLGAARRAWAALEPKLSGRVVLLGVRLARLAGLDEHPPYAWVEARPGLALCWMPHPSGLSHWWNEPAHVEDARRFLAGVLGLPFSPAWRAARLL